MSTPQLTPDQLADAIAEQAADKKAAYEKKLADQKAAMEGRVAAMQANVPP